jgi:TonB family protein
MPFPDIEGAKIINPAEIESATYRKTIQEWIENNAGRSYVVISSYMPRETMKRIFEMGNWEIPSYHIDKYQGDTMLYAVVCYEPGYLFKYSTEKNKIPGSDEIDQNDEEVFNIVDIQPVPKGGLEAFYQYVMDNLKYPEEAKNDGKEGKVFVEFIVRRNGEIDQVKVIKGFHGACDEEALRVINQSPDWIPGYKDDNAVDVRLILPVTFKLG